MLNHTKSLKQNRLRRVRQDPSKRVYPLQLELGMDKDNKVVVTGVVGQVPAITPQSRSKY